MPRDRLSEFEPTLVPKGEKVLLKELQEKLFLLYSKGLSTRDIQDILEDIYGTRLSASTISRLTDRIMPEVKDWLSRPLKEKYVAIFIDCMFPTVKEADKVVKKALYVVAGIDTDGYKEILGFWLARQESASFWVNVFNDLKARGVEDILVVVSDELKGIQEAVRSVYPMSDHQKCLVHKVRNSPKKVKYKDRKRVASALRAIYMSSTQPQAKENFERFKREYQAEYPQVVKDWERDLEEILTFYKYPYEIRRMLATTNFVESINSKIRKVIYGKRIFPTDEALLKVCYGVAMDLEEKWKKPLRDWERIYAQLIILFEGRL
ncbi:IS256 family transposase [Hydrogenobacter sp. T-2]|nr:IS256 family transposase [Hydrogenobacter sp. T-2]